MIEVITIQNNEYSNQTRNFICPDRRHNFSDEIPDHLKPTNKERLITLLHREDQHFDLLKYESKISEMSTDIDMVEIDLVGSETPETDESLIKDSVKRR